MEPTPEPPTESRKDRAIRKHLEYCKTNYYNNREKKLAYMIKQRLRNGVKVRQETLQKYARWL